MPMAATVTAVLHQETIAAVGGGGSSTSFRKNIMSDLVPQRYSWHSIGPLNISGRIKCLALHPRDPGILYAGSANGGVWKSTDAGATWRPLADPDFALPIGALGISLTQPDLLYAATGEGT